MLAIGSVFMVASILILVAPRFYLPISVAIIGISIVSLLFSTSDPAIFPPLAFLPGIVAGILTLLWVRPRNVALLAASTPF